MTKLRCSNCGEAVRRTMVSGRAQYRAGRNIALAGLPRSTNPYRVYTDSWKLWGMGWRVGRRVFLKVEKAAKRALSKVTVG